MHLDQSHQAAVRAILAAHDLSGIAVSVFGSRVHGRNLKPFSDLDLCLKGEGPLPEQQISQLKAAFEDSALPFKVDIVDWWALPDDFRDAIRDDMTPFRLEPEPTK